MELPDSAGDHSGDAPTPATPHDDRMRSALASVLALTVEDNPEALAARLLDEHRSLGGVLAATEAAQLRTAGTRGLAALRAVNAAIVEVLHRRLEERPLIATGRDLIDYLHVIMAHRLTESARALYLNSKNVLIRDEQISEGTIDKATVHIREVARRALELGSAAIILVHNHPSGDTAPSRSDITLTRDLSAALKPLGIVLHDHLVVATSGCFSFRAEGLL